MEAKEQVAIYEALVDQLLRETPDENEVTKLMETLGIDNSREPTQRVAHVLENMNFVLAQGFLRKESDDTSEYS